MENAKRDNNYVTTLLGVDMTTGEIPTKLVVDENTGRLLVNAVVTNGVTGGTGGNELSSYMLVNDDENATYEYYGYVNADQDWVIKRITIASAYAEFETGSGSYATAWANRASQTYTDYWSAF